MNSQNLRFLDPIFCVLNLKFRIPLIHVNGGNLAVNSLNKKMSISVSFLNYLK